MASSFFKKIKSEIQAHPVMFHPFWERFSGGTADREGICRFSIQYYFHVLQTRLYDAMVLSRTPNEQIQAALASILWDEYGQGDATQTHPAQFRRLLSALSLTERDWTKTEPIPEFEIYRDTHFHLCQSYPYRVGLGVVGLAMEYPIPSFYNHLVTGFRRYGLNDEALEFFLEHIPTDQAHSSLMESSLATEITREENREQIRAGVRRSLDARYQMMTGLERITFGGAEADTGVSQT